MNPYYDADKIGWEMYEIDFGEPNYSFNTLIFWKTKTNEIYMAHDSGCSCPIPFEEYKGKTPEDIAQKLTKVGSLEQAEEEFESHSEEDNKPSEMWGDVRRKLIEWGVCSVSAL